MLLKLRKLREEKGITQEEMAKLLGYTHKSGYNKLEMGLRRITLEQAKQISIILEKTIDEIFFTR